MARSSVSGSLLVVLELIGDPFAAWGFIPPVEASVCEVFGDKESDSIGVGISLPST